MCRLKRAEGLGFRDFGLFKEALLATKCWKIIGQPDSLIAKLFKSIIYFPSTYFEEASRNTMVLKRILWDNKCWIRALGANSKLMHGKQVPLINSNWLPGNSIHHLDSLNLNSQHDNTSN